MSHRFSRLAVVAFGLFSSVQAASAQTRAGVFAGADFFEWNFSPSLEEVPLGSRTGFAAGAVFDFRFKSRAGIRLEPGYVEKGSRITFPGDGFLFDEDFSVEFRLGYVELPVLFTFSFGSGSARPYLLTGPSVAYLTSAHAEAMGESEDAKEAFKKWEFALTAGAGIEIGRGRTRGFVEGRYTWGLTQIAEDEGEDVTVKNRGVQILAGVTFALGR